MSPSSKALILLVEDSADDAFFFRWALERSRDAAELIHAIDGASAIRALEQVRAPDGQRKEGCPDIVFLDLKMPVVSGFDVLTWMREHPFHPPLDLAVLSGSNREADILRAKSLGVAAFYTKPLRPESLASHLSAWRAKTDLVAV